MSDTAKHAMAVLRRVAEFLEDLPDDQVADLAEGRARLTYIPWGATEPVKPAKRAPATKKSAASTVDSKAVAAELAETTSAEAAQALLATLKKVDDLKAVATEVGMPFTSKATRATLMPQLIEFTVTSRFYGAGVRSL
jgi:hypothetical protein